MVMGNLVLNAVAAGLFYTVAVNVFAPIVILSFILSVFKTLSGLLVIALLLLQHAKSWMQINKAMDVNTGFIIFLFIH